MVQVRYGENDVRVIPLRQIAAEGTEQPGSLKINIAEVNKEDPEVPLRVSQFLTQSAKLMLRNAAPDVRPQLTPAVIVYDLDKMTEDGLNPYGYLLPENPDARRNVVLAIYPVTTEFFPDNF